jgi:predicted alpha/beta superfamily hydrolase
MCFWLWARLETHDRRIVMRRICLVAVLVVTATSATAVQVPSGSVAPQVLETGQAVKTRTDRYLLRSNQIGREFLIEVTTPQDLEAGQKAPAIYALDGGYGLFGASVGVLIGARRLAPAIVVAVGYNDPGSIARGPRSTDLAHVKALSPNGNPIAYGGGAAFEHFLLNEVRPFLETRYPIDRGKDVLVGHSMGGLFAATVLATKPEAFANYIIASPAAELDPALIDKIRAVGPRGGGRKVVVAAAARDIGSVAKLLPVLADAMKAAGFDVVQQVYEGENHSSSYLMLAPKALPVILPAPVVGRGIQN